jgi:hypothetical protein
LLRLESKDIDLAELDFPSNPPFLRDMHKQPIKLNHEILHGLNASCSFFSFTVYLFAID